MKPVYWVPPMDAPKGASSYEPALGYFVVALAVFLTGPGVLSLDATLFKTLFGRRELEIRSATDSL